MSIKVVRPQLRVPSILKLEVLICTYSNGFMGSNLQMACHETHLFD